MKNEFLLSMGYYPTDESSPDRKKIMQAALRGETSKWERLDRGCRIWEALEPDIRDFLTSLPNHYGFMLSDQYHHERRTAESSMSTLNEMARKIQNRTFDEQDIDRLWHAADTVRRLLRDLEKSRRFSEFVLDIDTSQIRG